MFERCPRHHRHAADPCDVSRHRSRLSGRPDQHRRVFARRRRGAVRRTGHRRLRSQGADHRTDRPHRPDHVSLWHRHSLRAPVLRGHDRCGGDRKYNLLALVAVARRAFGCARAWPGLWHQDRPHARHLRRLDDQHRDAAGRARRHAEQRAVDRLFDRLSIRRDRPDPVHLFHDAPGPAEISAEGAALPHGRDYARRELARARRSASSARSCRPASRSRWSARAARTSCRRTTHRLPPATV